LERAFCRVVELLLALCSAALCGLLRALLCSTLYGLLSSLLCWAALCSHLLDGLLSSLPLLCSHSGWMKIIWTNVDPYAHRNNFKRTILKLFLCAYVFMYIIARKLKFCVKNISCVDNFRNKKLKNTSHMRCVFYFVRVHVRTL